MPTTALFERAHHDGVDYDPAARPRRRQFSAEYKLGILEEYDRLTDPRAKGALLRREGLYSRRARDVGALKELGPKNKPKRRTAEQVEIERLRRRNDRLEADLAKHRLALEIQGIMGTPPYGPRSGSTTRACASRPARWRTWGAAKSPTP